MALNEREKLVEIMTSQQVVNSEFFQAVREQNPLLSKLMLNKFKAFLVDDYFTDFERQTMLIRFFEDEPDINLVKEIITLVKDCEQKEDYSEIIMEWTYHNSEHIKQQNLAKLDAAALCDAKEKTNRIKRPTDMTDAILEGLLQLTSGILGSGDEGPEEE